jgi:hypothetical protein
MKIKSPLILLPIHFLVAGAVAAAAAAAAGVGVAAVVGFFVDNNVLVLHDFRTAVTAAPAPAPAPCLFLPLLLFVFGLVRALLLAHYFLSRGTPPQMAFFLSFSLSLSFSLTLFFFSWWWWWWRFR